MRRPARSVSLCLGLLAACLSVAAMTAAPAGAGPVTTARATAQGPRAIINGAWIQIKNRYTYKCIDDPGQSWTPGQQLQTWDCNMSPAQQWEFRTDSNGYLNIYNNQNGLCITDEGGMIGNGVPVVQTYCDGSASQEWKLSYLYAIPEGGLWYLQSQANELRNLGVPNFGAGIYGNWLYALPCGCGADQQWFITIVFDNGGSIRQTDWLPKS
jgi:hypothetical protein